MTKLTDDELRLGRREGDPTLDGMPWWVKAIGLVGVPSAIALYLIWALVNAVIPTVVQMQQMLSDHMKAQERMREEQSLTNTRTDTIIKVLRITCINQAKDDVSRERCLQ